MKHESTRMGVAKGAGARFEIAPPVGEMNPNLGKPFFPVCLIFDPSVLSHYIPEPQ
jgi:hypothetical protein